MPYVLYGGKMITVGDKYVTSAQIYTPIFSGWTNSTWDTFESSGQNVISAIEGQGTKGEANTEFLPFEVGDWIRITGNLTLNSGVYPTNTAEIHLINQLFGLVGTVTFNPALPINTGFEITSWPSMNFGLRFQNYSKTAGNACNCSCELFIYKLVL